MFVEAWPGSGWVSTLVVCLVVIVVSACSSTGPVAEETQVPYTLLLPPGCAEGFLSPDGRWLACLGTSAGQWGIWVQEVDGDRVMPVSAGGETEGVNYYSLAWAPDAQTLAFVYSAGPPPGSDYRLSVFEIDGGQTKVLYQGGGFVAGMRWSPRGNTLALVDGQQLVLAPLAGSHDVPIETGVILPPLSDNGLAWSPDGERLICPVAVDDAIGLHIVEVETLARHVLWPSSGVAIVYIPSWSPNGERIAILKGRYSVSDPAQEDVGIVLLNADGSNPVEIDLPSTPFELSADLLWSPDGTLLATMLRNGTAVDLWLIPAWTGGPYQLTESGDIRRVIGWTPDGQGVLVSTWEAIEVVPIR